jgi:hypothetical protein
MGRHTGSVREGMIIWSIRLTLRSRVKNKVGRNSIRNAVALGGERSEK